MYYLCLKKQGCQKSKWGGEKSKTNVKIVIQKNQ